MNKDACAWVVVHTPIGQRNIICGPFDCGLTAIAFISEDFNYVSTSVHDSLESALKDDNKFVMSEQPLTNEDWVWQDE